jgi:hypothetical protein
MKLTQNIKSPISKNTTKPLNLTPYNYHSSSRDQNYLQGSYISKNNYNSLQNNNYDMQNIGRNSNGNINTKY